MSKDFLWTEKFRPHTIEDTILPDNLKQVFQKIVDSGEIPNMLLSGTAGLGKTTVARALCDQLDLDYIVVNGSEEGNIETLRGKIKQFASSVSLHGGYKVVILDEADYLNPQSTQPALRGFIEQFSDNCRFILTCNLKNRIIEPLHSRCGVYEFNTPRKDMGQLCAQFMRRLEWILGEEGVSYDRSVVANMIQTHAPDWRRIVVECQRHSTVGLSDDRVVISNNTTYDVLFDHLKDKQFAKMRQWVVNNIDVDTSTIFRGIYDRMMDSVEPNSVPQVVLILADYQYKAAFVADAELNTVACLTELMVNVEFK
mgnify:CR=1 FL=1